MDTITPTSLYAEIYIPLALGWPVGSMTEWTSHARDRFAALADLCADLERHGYYADLPQGGHNGFIRTAVEADSAEEMEEALTRLAASPVLVEMLTEGEIAVSDDDGRYRPVHWDEEASRARVGQADAE